MFSFVISIGIGIGIGIGMRVCWWWYSLSGGAGNCYPVKARRSYQDCFPLGGRGDPAIHWRCPQILPKCLNRSQHWWDIMCAGRGTLPHIAATLGSEQLHISGRLCPFWPVYGAFVIEISLRVGKDKKKAATLKVSAADKRIHQYIIRVSFECCRLPGPQVMSQDISRGRPCNAKSQSGTSLAILQKKFWLRKMMGKCWYRW